MKRILIIDDDKRIISALAVRLEDAGYEVLTAVDGFHGLRSAMSAQPDLVLMDIMMPMGMGFSVAERLRSTGFEQLPIIFMTASKRTGLRKMARDLGAAGYFEKPYDAEELLSAIFLILGGDRPPRPARGGVLTAVRECQKLP